MLESKAIVFVVDDDVSMREALESLIRSAGFRVETFASAQDFWARGRADVPACLVLDVRLPGLSGLDLQNRIVETNREIPIVFITGHGDVPTSVRAMKAGAVEFLIKPFSDQGLLDAIQQAIKRDQSARHQQAEMQDLRGRYESLPPARETPSNGKSGLWAPCKTTIFLSLKSNFLRSSGHREIFVLASLVIVVESFPRRER